MIEVKGRKLRRWRPARRPTTVRADGPRYEVCHPVKINHVLSLPMVIKQCDSLAIPTSLFAAEVSFLGIYQLPLAPPPEEEPPLNPPLLPPLDDELVETLGMVTVSTLWWSQFLQS